MKKNASFFLLLILIAIGNSYCSKSDSEKKMSKEELIQSVSDSKEFRDFIQISRDQSNAILSTNQSSLCLNSQFVDDEIRQMQESKKRLIAQLFLKYDLNSLRSLNRDDIKIIVRSVLYDESLNRNKLVDFLNTETFDAASCKKQYDKEVNVCFENFLIDEGACFLQGLWGIVSGCHVDSVRDHLKCNRDADRHFQECK